MKKQEIYNTVTEHLLAQGERSIEDGVCVYRNQDGLKCAAGVLIPDHLYDCELEGNSAEYLDVWKEIGYSEDEVALIVDLQYIHDQIPIDRWPVYLSRLAERHKLQDITP